MAYTVQYTAVGNKKYPMKIKKASKLRTAAVVACFLLLLTVLNIGTVREQIARFLLPGNPEVTQVGFSQLVEDVKRGEPVADALAEFCVFVVENA